MTNIEWTSIEAVAEKIVQRVSSKHIFSYFSKNDIEQEIRCIIIEAYNDYDISKGPLENFLARSVSNRLKNLKRNNNSYVQKPCAKYKCYFYDKINDLCLFNRDKCLDWKKFNSIIDAKHSVSVLSTYESEELMSNKCNSSIDMNLMEILELSKKRKMSCYIAIYDFINSGKEIPDVFKNDVIQLIKEVS